MSNEEEKRCPLCAEEMDWTDQQLKPCKCGYQVCVWCWHHLMDMAEKDETEGRCPACRAPYDKEKIVGMEAKFERVVANNSIRKHKPPKAKPKTNEGRKEKDLSNVRVIQRKMAYVIGLPLSLADEDLLQRKEYFGQYGKVTKVSLSRTAGGAVQQFINDTCSVYITYSKEEEAIRCIQSVHGFVLEGRFLRASYGTAKYCHAWLRNTPCTNPACLYLHSVGAEEDSFGKDEVAAVHTRSRVQQMVGATHNLQRCSGNVLPPPVEEPFYNSSVSTDTPFAKSGMKDGALDAVTSSGHLTCLSSFEDKDGSVRAPNKMSTFVDIVGRACISGPEKDGNMAEDRRILNLCSELSIVGIDKDNHLEAESTDAMLCKVSSSNHIVNGFLGNKEFKEPFREPSNHLASGRADITPNDACFTEEQSYSMLDSGRQVEHGPSSFVREDLLPFDNIKMKDSDITSQTACLLPSSYPAKISEDTSDRDWWSRESHGLNDYIVDHNTVNNHVDEASIQFTCVNSILNDGYNERKFRSSAKSDRIYRCSNSFSNEEIVEHLRRLDDDDKTNDDDNPALDAMKSSIISNLMSLDFDACDDSLTMPRNLVGLFDETNGQHGSSWNFQNSNQSGFCFANQEGSVSQTDLDSSFIDIGQGLKKCSGLQDSRETTERYLCKPQYHASRTQSLTPPGFSLPSRDPPPGFPACERTDQVRRATSGSHLVNTSFPNNHYRTPSTGNSSNTSDVDLFDPAILVVGRGKPTNGLSNSCLDMRSAYASQPSTFEDEARLWLLMQQSTPAIQDPKFSQNYMQQPPPAHQDLRYLGHTGIGDSSWNDVYGISSRLMYQHQTNSPSSFAQFSQQKYANGLVSNGYQTSLDEVQRRGEVSVAEVERNERLGFNKFFPGYGDLMFQMPSSGDVCTRVFGM